jgi:hypothetical protein
VKLSLFLQVSKNNQMPNFMKILPVGASMRTDRRTDGLTERHDEANCRFSEATILREGKPRKRALKKKANEEYEKVQRQMTFDDLLRWQSHV